MNLARLSKQLWFQVFVAVLAGLLLGILFPSAGTALKPLGDGFVRLIRMIVAPVIFCTVVHGIAGMRDMKRAGRVALKALIYFEVVTTLALIVALFAVNLWQPGAGMHIDARSLDPQSVASYTTGTHAPDAVQFLLGLIPETLIGAFAQGEILQVLVVSVLFAVPLAALGARAQPVVDLIEGLSQVFFRIVGIIMWAAPLGAFGAIAFTVGKFGATSLKSLGSLILEFYLVSAAFAFIVLGLIARSAGVSLFRLLKFLREEIVIVFATTSTESVLPRLIQKLRALGCDESVVGLVVPTGYSFNLDGTCLYLATVTVFLAQATDTPLSSTQQLTLLVFLLIASKGAAGVAGAALIVLAATLSSTGTIPVVSLALIVGIHRLLAEALTFVNLIGNSVATIVVARWEGAVNDDLLQSQVGLRKRLTPHSTP
jgi:aerobic C4-dicarboxylate transport protein